MAAAALALLSFLPASAEDVSERPPEERLMYANDWAAMVEEYWPKIALGDVDAMVVSYEALNSCSHFRDAILVSGDLNEFETEMAGEHPEMLRFGRGIFYKCKRLVERFDWYPGWQDLRLRAALAGDSHSRIALLRDFYYLRNERPRESFPFSPAEFVIEALDNRDPKLFTFAAVTDAPWGIREENGLVVSSAWRLVYCHYKGNCRSRESMRVYCLFVAEECTRYDNLYQQIEAEAAGEHNFAAAQEMAAELIEAIEARRYDDLGLLIVD
jgi:hypothetical protein